MGGDGVGAISVKNHVHRAEAQGLAAFEARFHDFRAVDIGSVGGAHVFEDCGTVIDSDLAVRSGDTEVFDFEGVAGAAAEKIQSGLELDFPSLRSPGMDDEARHCLRLSPTD